MSNCCFVAVILAGWLVAPAVCAAGFQFELLGASDDWIAVRENIPASPTDTTACNYPGLDPSRYVGVRVHFIRLSAEAKRGRAVPLERPAGSMALYTPARPDEGCTSTVDAERRWNEIAAHAKSLGIELPATLPTPVVLGAVVPAKDCVLIGGAPLDTPPCRREFKQVLGGGTIRIAVSLIAIPEAPDESTCQSVGHRFGAAIQVAGFDFGQLGSGVAPGGFVSHYDCRGQQFDALRLYALDHAVVLVGSFSGANIADRDEYPFVVVFPARPAP
jgi:hypothetical protein